MNDITKSGTDQLMAEIRGLKQWSVISVFLTIITILVPMLITNHNLLLRAEAAQAGSAALLATVDVRHREVANLLEEVKATLTEIEETQTRIKK